MNISSFAMPRSTWLLKWCPLLFLALWPLAAGAQDSVPEAPSDKDLTALLDFDPDCPLTGGPVASAEDIPESNGLARMGRLIWARGFGNKHCTPVVVYAVLYEGGSFLTDGIRKQVTNAATRRKALEKKWEPEGAKEFLFPRVFQVGEARKGYHFLIVEGDRGAETATALTSQDGAYDLVLFTFYIARDGDRPDAIKVKTAMPQADGPTILAALEKELFR